MFAKLRAIDWREGRFLNPHHPKHFGSVLFVGWLACALTMLPAVVFAPSMASPMNNIWVEALVSGGPILAHLYSLRALFALREKPKFQANMMAALFTLSYFPAGVLAMIVLPWPHAFTISLAGVGLGIFSLGLLFPGLSPFFAYALNAKFIRPQDGPFRLAFAFLLFFIGWVIAGILAEVLSSI